MPREVQLMGGPAHGKRLLVDDGIQHVTLPTLDRSKECNLDDPIVLEINPFTGLPLPAKLPISKVSYKEVQPGWFGYQESAQ